MYTATNAMPTIPMVPTTAKVTIPKLEDENESSDEEVDFAVLSDGESEGLGLRDGDGRLLLLFDGDGDGPPATRMRQALYPSQFGSEGSASQPDDAAQAVLHASEAVSHISLRFPGAAGTPPATRMWQALYPSQCGLLGSALQPSDATQAARHASEAVSHNSLMFPGAAAMLELDEGLGLGEGEGEGD